MPKITDKQPSWAGIDPNLVIEFLSKFRVISQIAIDPSSVVDYIYEQLQNAELTRWRVLLSCAKEPRSDPLWTEDLSVVGMPLVPLIARSRGKNDPTSLGVVTDPATNFLVLPQAISRSLTRKLARVSTRRERRLTGHTEIQPRAC